jgi:predicted enzyme related to lactoylglutathione lyase
MDMRYVHTNLVAKDWKKLSEFYTKVFQCVPKPPERDLYGEWLDNLTGIKNARIGGIHLLLPGYKENGPTLEIFQYRKNEENGRKTINLEGYGHIAFAVSDVDACLEEVKKHGGSAVGETVNTEVAGVGKLHVVYAKDPEGNIIEIQKWD